MTEADNPSHIKQCQEIQELANDIEANVSLADLVDSPFWQRDLAETIWCLGYKRKVKK